MSTSTKILARIQNNSGGTRIIAKIQNNNGRLSATAPITLKNQLNEIQSIEDIADVEEIEVVNGATLQYNSATDKYEIKPIDLAASGINGGTF